MPNPFRESVSVVLSLARAGQVQVEVYSVTGRRVRTLVERAFEAGVHRFAWDGLDDQGRDAGPGIYFVRTSADRQTITRRVTLVR
jgi:flagellar hook assembly protein FlgD